jgi:RNA recognition motif-containing protein
MNIYVGNLSFRATEDSLRELFSQYGEVTSARIMTDKNVRAVPKASVLSTWLMMQTANAAINALNDQDFMERKLRVNEAKPRTEGDSPSQIFQQGRQWRRRRRIRTFRRRKPLLRKVSSHDSTSFLPGKRFSCFVPVNVIYRSC